MSDQMFGALKRIQKGTYMLSLGGFELRVGAPERTIRGKKLFILSEETMYDVESFVGELGIVIRNESEDRDLEHLFEKLYRFRGQSGRVGLVVKPYRDWGWNWSEIRLVFPEEVTDTLEIPS